MTSEYVGDDLAASVASAESRLSRKRQRNPNLWKRNMRKAKRIEQEAKVTHLTALRKIFQKEA